MAFLYTIYQHPVLVYLILITLVAWDLVWRALALWRSAKNGHKVWFVCLLIFNTLGILPIIYLIINSVKDKKARKKENKDITKKSKPEIFNITFTDEAGTEKRSTTKKQGSKKEKQEKSKKTSKKDLSKVKELVEQQFLMDEVTG